MTLWTIMLAIPTWSILGSLLWHIRGGLFGNLLHELIPFWGTTISRLSYSAIILLPLLLMHAWYIYIACWALLYIGTIFSWSNWQYMVTPSSDILSMSFRGALLTVPAGVVADSALLALCGLTLGPCYYVGMHYMPLGWTDLDKGIVTDGTPNCEYLFGLILGAAIICSVIFGV